MRPFLPRTVAVELDAVSVGIVEVERLADAVVGSPGERDAGVDDAAERVGELRAVGIADRRVEEAVEPRGGGLPPRLSHVFRPMWWW